MKGLFIIVNAVLVVLFILAQYLKFSPEAKARFGVILGVVFMAYLLLIAGISLDAMRARAWSALPFAAFLFIPFFIGKKVSYESLPLWSNVQLSTLVASLIVCILIVRNGI